MQPQAGFPFAFWMVVGHEGGYTTNPNDDGNWTGGREGSGVLKGTKYGISAASYPQLDIKNLTLDAAKEIYFEAYWLKGRCDQLPPPLALLHFDAGVNAGFGNSSTLRANAWLQASVGAKVDGMIGPQTIAAAVRAAENESRLTSALGRYQKERMFHNMSARRWTEFGNGWTLRCFAVAVMAGRLMQQIFPGTRETS